MHRWERMTTHRETIVSTHAFMLQVYCVQSSFIEVVVSTLKLKKLKLPTLAQPRPYKLQWLNIEGQLAITKQVSLAFTLGNYKDEVLHDVEPIEATHILLGRPLQYDRKVTHDGVTNRFTFVHRGMKVTLKPLSPKDVTED
ncbi:hypothetical protein CR513_30852, partial [Mucuna pruriens]